MRTFNWGHKIAIAYLVFVAGILFLVFKASQESFDLVEKDYYEAELRYQERIDETKRTQSLSQPPTIQHHSGEIIISFPSDFVGKQIKGDAFLYCPSDARKDIKTSFSVQDDALVLKVPSGNKGMHRLKLQWSVAGKNYFHEENIFL